MSVTRLSSSDLFRQIAAIPEIGKRQVFQGKCQYEVVGYQRRFHCPEEGPSDWMSCEKEDARIIVRNQSAGWEVRPVFVFCQLEST